MVRDQQEVLRIGSRLIALLAVASIAVLVGGRMADQTRRVGLLKAVGATPRLVALVLLAEVLLVITVMLVALAAVNAIFVTWATALDAKHASALARALGATPQQVSTGLSAARVLPALVGGVLGIAGGLALFAAVGGGDDGVTGPPLWQLLAVAPVTVLVTAALTTIPARRGVRRPAAEALEAEIA
jgi:ABC-type lipoprotein release transport system permease subunit